MSTETQLWVNVIVQAIHDATIATNTGKNTDREREQARAWFDLSNPDFIEVCSLAGLDPDATHEKARRTMARYDAAISNNVPFELTPVSEPTPRPKAKGPRRYEAHGLSLTLAEWSTRLGVPAKTLRSRLQTKTPAEVLRSDYKPRRDGVSFNPSGRQAKRYTFKGVSKTVTEWAMEFGIQPRTLAARLRYGHTIESALTSSRAYRRGVVSDLRASKGTGAGSTAQETPEIDFSRTEVPQ